MTRRHVSVRLGDRATGALAWLTDPDGGGETPTSAINAALVALYQSRQVDRVGSIEARVAGLEEWRREMEAATKK